MEDRERSRLRASLTATSRAWLQTLPIASVGLRMDDDVVRVAVGLSLGANLCEPYTCTCGVLVDARGTHGLAACKRSAGHHPRHGLLNDVVWLAMLRAQVPSCKEPTGLSISDGKRPDGVSLIPWSRGAVSPGMSRHPTPLAPSHLPSSDTHAGSAAARAEAAKTLKYSALASTHVFVPLAFETLGAWGPEAAAFVAELGRRTAAVTGDPRETAFLRQRFSVVIQRGNAIACLGSIPSAPSN